MFMTFLGFCWMCMKLSIFVSIGGLLWALTIYGVFLALGLCGFGAATALQNVRWRLKKR